MKESVKDKLQDMLFDSTLGRIFLFGLCIFLFIMTLGFGYIIMGLMVRNHIEKKEPKPGPGTSGPLGVFLAWPIVLIMKILDME